MRFRSLSEALAHVDRPVIIDGRCGIVVDAVEDHEDGTLLIGVYFRGLAGGFTSWFDALDVRTF